MKTPRILQCIVLSFISNNANSQPIRTEYPVTVNFFIPCVNEWIDGGIIIERVAWTNLKEVKGKG